MRWAQFHAAWGDLVATEASWLRQRGAQLVFADIPPLAFAAAATAGVRAVGMANFSWDWIYGHLARREPALAAAADACAEAYRTADLLLQLPFAGDLSAFPRREPIPLVARRPRVPREETRRRLGWPSGTVVLLSFGGMGLPGFDPRVLAPLTDGWFVAVGGAWTDAPANVGAVAPERLAELELRYEDVVGAADVVVTKPGYGIVSDAIGASVRLVYTDRGDFPEYPILVREMERYLPSAYVDNEALLGGTLRNALDRVLAIPMPDPPRLDGASVAAERLLQLTGARSL
jgi:L-arabinokinase